MFSKFSTKPSKARSKVRTWTRDPTPQGLSTIENGHVSGAPVKRQKIAKACDRCRSHRIKCDEQKPCMNCADAETRCIVSYNTQRPATASTDSFAQDAQRAALPVVGSMSRSPRSDETNFRHALDENNSNSPSLPFSCSPTDQYDSAVGRYKVLLGSTTDSGDNTFNAEPNNAGDQILPVATPPATSLFPQLPHPAIPSIKTLAVPGEISRSQRSHFLQIFWDICHPPLLIISEDEFSNLAEMPTVSASSVYSVQMAMLDAMVALGIQHSHTAGLGGRLSGQGKQPMGNTDWPGFEYFHRSRARMRDSFDDSVDAVRCMTLMALYFLRANAIRDAYNLLGIAVRKAHISRLHRVPPNHLSNAEKTTRAQLWWCLFRLDVECALQLDVPAANQRNLVKCPIPTEVALINYVSTQGRQSSELRSCKYSMFLRDLADTISYITAHVSTADIMEACETGLGDLEQQAIELLNLITNLDSWHESLPQQLQFNPQPDDLDYATIISPTQPLQLQRHRILLRLHYHHAYVLIQRPFLHVRQSRSGDARDEAPGQDSHRRVSAVEQNIDGALHHATIIINIVFNVCSTSDLLYGWAEVLQPLWNATLTIMAYIYVKSSSARAKQSFDALTRAQAVLASFGLTCSSAAAANDMVQSLSNNLHGMMSQSASQSDTTNLRGDDFLAPSFVQQQTKSDGAANTSSLRNYSDSPFAL